jgi:hypothetical protein
MHACPYKLILEGWLNVRGIHSPSKCHGDIFFWDKIWILGQLFLDRVGLRLVSRQRGTRQIHSSYLGRNGYIFCIVFCVWLGDGDILVLYLVGGLGIKVIHHHPRSVRYPLSGTHMSSSHTFIFILLLPPSTTGLSTNNPVWVVCASATFLGCGFVRSGFACLVFRYPYSTWRNHPCLTLAPPVLGLTATATGTCLPAC